MGKYRSIPAPGCNVKVMNGNTKLGKTPNVSLLPIVTCDRTIGCALRKKCYACKFLKRKTVREAWGHNTRQAENPVAFFDSLRAWFAKHSPRFFRFFVGGDLPSAEFWQEMIRFAAEYPETRFLLFTKRYAWVNANPNNTENLTVVFSAWPGTEVPNPDGRPIAWMREPADPDPRIPTDAIECEGDCETCGLCWSLPRIGLDVVFDKH